MTTIGLSTLLMVFDNTDKLLTFITIKMKKDSLSLFYIDRCFSMKIYPNQ